MKHRTLLWTGISLCILGALLLYAAVQFALPASADAKGRSMLQTALHDADEIEVDLLSSSNAQNAKVRYRTKRFGEEYAVTAKRRLSAAQTQEFLTVLRQHVLDSSLGALCHDPGYVLRFKRGGRKILSASLCLHCLNWEIEPYPYMSVWITILDPGVHATKLPRLEKFFATLDPA